MRLNEAFTDLTRGTFLIDKEISNYGHYTL